MAVIVHQCVQAGLCVPISFPDDEAQLIGDALLALVIPRTGPVGPVYKVTQAGGVARSLWSSRLST